MGIKCPECHYENPDDTVYCGKCAAPLQSFKEIEVIETLEAPKEELTIGRANLIPAQASACS